MSLRILRLNDTPVPAAPGDGVVCQVARGCGGCLVRHLAVCAALPVEKDIDVMSPTLAAQYLTDDSALPPVTVSAALELFDDYDVRISGRKGVIVAEDSPFARMFRLAGDLKQEERAVLEDMIESFLRRKKQSAASDA